MTPPYPPAATGSYAPLRQPYSPVRMPTFWLLLPLLGLGLLGLLLLLGVQVSETPTAALVVLPPTAAFTVLCLALLRQVDRLGRRPWWLVSLAFGWGAIGAVAVGLSAGSTLDDLLAAVVSPEFAGSWGAALVAPTAEEIGKGAGVLLLLLVARPHLRDAFSGAVYGAVIGLGFSLVEDVLYVLAAADDTLPDSVPDAVQVAVLRVLLTGVIGHPLYTAVVGAGISYAVTRLDRSRARRFTVLGGLFGAAWLAHAANNSPLTEWLSDAFERVPWLNPLGGYFLVIGGPVAVAACLLIWVRADAARHLVRQLADASLREEGAAAGPYRLAAGETAPAYGPVFAVATPAEARVVVHPWARIRLAWRLRRAYGPSAPAAARRLWRAQTAFFDIAGPPDGPGVAFWPERPLTPWHRWPVVTEVGRARAELVAARFDLLRATGRTELSADVHAQVGQSVGVHEPSGTGEPIATAPSVPGGSRRTLGVLLVAGLLVAGILHWAALLLTAALLAVPRIRRAFPRPVRRGLVGALVVPAYLWAALLLLAVVYPDGV